MANSSVSALMLPSARGRQPVSNGEIYDFEVTPTALGDMAFEVRGGSGALLITMPIRVIP